MLQSKIAKNPEILSTEVGGETVLMNVATGKYYGLDDIGTAIWNRLQTPVRVDALCAALTAEYDGTAVDITRDILALLDQLVGDGLVEVPA